MVVSEANNPVLVTVHVQQGSTIARNKHLLTNGAPSPDIFCPSTRRVLPYITSQDRRFRCLTFSCIKCYRVRLITIEEYSCVSNVGIKLINLAITVNKRVLTFTIFLIYAWALLFSAFLFTLYAMEARDLSLRVFELTSFFI